VAGVVFSAGTSGTLAGWTTATVINSTNTAQTGQLTFTHAYAGTRCVGLARAATVSCPSSLTPQSPVPASSTDAITNTSTGNLTATQTVSAPSCLPVQLAHTNLTTDPMLPRYTTSFSPSGITFGSGAYAAGVMSQTLGGSPVLTLISLGTTTYSYGYGVTFKTTSTSGQLFGLGSKASGTPSSGSTTFDRTLSLSGGKLTFTAAGMNAPTTAKLYNDGISHTAYVSVQASATGLLGLLGALVVSHSTTVTIYVDGVKDGSAPTSGSILNTFGQLGTPAGYWYVGPAYVGSLADFVVYNGTSSPTTTPAAPYTTATEWWPLNDSGATTFIGMLPPALANPCSQVNVSFAFTNPGDTSIASMTLFSFADTTARSVAAPEAGQPQGLTISIARDISYKTDIGGLHLYVPITFSYGTSPASGWTQSLTWSGDSTDVFIA